MLGFSRPSDSGARKPEVPIIQRARTSCGLELPKDGTVEAMNNSSSPRANSPLSSDREATDDSMGVSQPGKGAAESGAFTWFAGLAAVIAVLCVVCGVVMLILKWSGFHPWSFLTQVPLICLPIAFVLLIVALVLAARRRRSL